MSYLHRPAASEVARWMGETTVDVLWELYGDEVRAEKPSGPPARGLRRPSSLAMGRRWRM